MISVKNLKKLTIKDWAASILGAAVLALFFAPGEWSKDLLSVFSIMRIAVMVAFICLVFSYKNSSNISKSIETAPKFAKILMIVAPLVVFLFVLIQVADPEFAVWLVRCDTRSCGINFRHAIFIKAGLEIAALVFFVASARKFAKKGEKIQFILMIFFTFVTFVLAGEELSWGQRIIHFSTPEVAKSMNAQGEFNLHDMATQLFQNVWYVGSWALLIVLPFFHEKLREMLNKSRKFSFLTDFLPPTYYILIFGAAFALVDPVWSETGIHWGSLLFMVLSTLAVLIKFIIPAREKIAEKLCLVLGVFTVALFSNLFVSEVWNLNAGAPGEFLEIFLAFGILLWAINIFSNLKSGKSQKVSRR